MTANLTLAAEPARMVVAPRRPRSFWRKPWWWRLARYRMTPSAASVQKRLDGLEAALICLRVLPEPSASRPSLRAVPGGVA